VINSLATSGVACKVAAFYINIMAYADDMVFLVPSWKGIQLLISLLNLCVKEIDMPCNLQKKLFP